MKKLFHFFHFLTFNIFLTKKTESSNERPSFLERDPVIDDQTYLEIQEMSPVGFPTGK